MTKFRASAAFTLSLGCVVWLATMAAGGDGKEKGKKEDRPKEAESAKYMNKIGLAHKLIDFGMAEKSPTALLLAAEILHDTPVTHDPKRIAKEEGFEKAKEKFGAKSVLALAKKMAKGDDNLQALMKTTESKLREKSRSPFPGGRVSRNGHLHSGNQASFRIHCHGHTHANVHPYNANGRVDLDLYVYRAGGGLVAQDTGLSSSAGVHWDGDGDFIIQVRMFSGDHCDYHLVVE